MTDLVYRPIRGLRRERDGAGGAPEREGATGDVLAMERRADADGRTVAAVRAQAPYHPPMAGSMPRSGDPGAAGAAAERATQEGLRAEPGAGERLPGGPGAGALR